MPVYDKPLLYKGRGSLSSTPGRFEKTASIAVDDGWGSLDAQLPPMKTEVAIDCSKSAISYNDSPDLPFDRSINPYRGCEHGCIYCFARPSHAYLGLSPGLDFESRLLVKPDAPQLLRNELGKRGYQCAPIALGTNTDPYQPLERRYQVMRQILEVLIEARHPVSIITKAALVERDIDVLSAMAQQGLVSVYVSITTLDRSLARTMSPRAAAPQRRLQTVSALRAAGVPVGVLVAPVIPALNDHELERLVNAAQAAGAMAVDYILLRLPMEVAELFEQWLWLHYPLKAQHVMTLVKATRNGKVYNAALGQRMTGTGHYADMLAQRFRLVCKRLQMPNSLPGLRTDLFRKPVADSGQMAFDFFY